LLGAASEADFAVLFSGGESDSQRDSKVKFHAPLLLVLGLFMALSTTFNVVNPIWEAIDEPGHFQYAKFVAEHHAIPTRDSDLRLWPVGGDVNCDHSEPGRPAVRCVARGSVVNEPPLYYLLEAPFVLPIDLNGNASWVANPTFTWWDYPLRNGAALHTLSEAWPYKGMVLGVHVMREVSAFMVGGAIAATYFTVLAIRRTRVLALLAAATAAVTPGLLLTSASVNNDNAAILTGSLALMAAVKSVTSSANRWRWLIAYGVLAFLAMQSKATAYFLLPLSLLLVGLLLRRSRRDMVVGGALGAAIAATLGILALRATRFDLLGLIRRAPLALRQDWDCHCSLPLQHYWGAVPNLWETYWASYGWETFHPPRWVYQPFLAVALVAIGALVYALQQKIRNRAFRAWLRSSSGASVFLLAAAFFILLVMVDYRWLLSHSDGGTTRARFLFPAVLASTTILVFGIARLPNLLRKATFVVLFASCLSLIGYSIRILPGSFGPTLPVYGDTGAAGAKDSLQVAFNNGMELVGWNPPVAPGPGQPLHLRLFWAANKQPDFDYSAFVRLTDSSGSTIHDADHGPGAGVGLLSHLWQPGEVIPDDWTVNVPTDARPGSYQVELGVYDYRDLRPVASANGQTSVALGVVILQ
jgi:Dolichyl-phosphate-mannose-protein mannosyltransferase